ncbi:TIGR03643 family protein [Limnobacter sp.]|uniref:TIGR03643 family protein n=1 Tax=Limnobacter sp. TaxID=2003368 RepID=UPI00258B9592|nr:TIGR03643 family protein [Limnobacter sp.]HEX5485480.1 TIGR03643 family protein [Limnobacter sp.]
MKSRTTAKVEQLEEADVSRIVEMAWEDRTPFEAIETLYGLNESDVIGLMRREMKKSSFNMWRARVSSRATKHKMLRNSEVKRSHCPTQYKPR